MCVFFLNLEVSPVEFNGTYSQVSGFMTQPNSLAGRTPILSIGGNKNNDPEGKEEAAEAREWCG